MLDNEKIMAVLQGIIFACGKPLLGTPFSTAPDDNIITFGTYIKSMEKPEDFDEQDKVWICSTNQQKLDYREIVDIMAMIKVVNDITEKNL